MISSVKIVDENGDLKISHFGLSALPEHLRNDGLLHMQRGTPAYIAPEVMRKKGYDGARLIFGHVESYVCSSSRVSSFTG